MNEELLILEPGRLWHYFREILEVPRPSKKEEKIIAYIKEFGKKFGLETHTDKLNNVLIRKPATKGNEHMKMVVLQSHLDMVGEKNSDIDHDFGKDPIEAYIAEEWVKANGTTLGADCGIGIAAQLAILESNDISHGPIECLFTVDEETGLTGAFGLESNFLKSRILINVDSEDEGELFIGCVGGKDTIARLGYKRVPLKGKYKGIKIELSGLVGGHSGDDIHKERGNSVKMMNRLLWEVSRKSGARLKEFNAGNLRNAIPREATAVIAVPSDRVGTFKDFFNDFYLILKDEYKITEPSLKLTAVESAIPGEVIDLVTQVKLFNSLYACPHGVMAWSTEVPDFVDTSTNLAAVKTEDDHFLITTSQRSSKESAKEDICNMVASTFILAGARVSHSDGYPGWKPNPDSEITEITRQAYVKLFKEEPVVRAIHAGLECGLIGEKYPGIDMISFGPTIKGAHSPDERLHIKSLQKFWDLTLEVLKNIPAKENI